MPLYRQATAELRRVHRNASWVCVAIVLDGAWHPIDPAVAPASARAIEAGLVEYLPLMPVLAPDVPGAIEAAAGLARHRGIPSADEVPARDVLRGVREERIVADLS